MYFKRQYKKFGVFPTLDNYWTDYQEMYIDICNRYFYNDSKYYKLSIAQAMVNKNNNLSFTLKKNINKFLSAVNLVRYGKNKKLL